MHKTKVMKKNTENRPRPKATIYIKYDAEKAEKLIGYTTRWEMRKAETLNISRFIRMLIEKYDIKKSAFHEISGIHNMAFNKYQRKMVIKPKTSKLSILLSGIWRRKKTWKACQTCRKKCILEMLIIIIIYIILIKRK